MELLRLAHYPFLEEVRERVRKRGIDPGDVLTGSGFQAARERAVARVEGALKDGIPPATLLGESDAWQELMSVAIARMLVARSGDMGLVKRHAAAEAARVQATLERDPEMIPECAAALEVHLSAGPEGHELHFADYLRHAPDGDGWKLLFRPVAKGRVSVDEKQAAAIIAEALRRRTVDELDGERKRPMPARVGERLDALLAPLEETIEEARQRWGQGDFGPVQPGLFPPCVKELFEAMKRGENVVHHGRFAFATFLHTVGWDSEQILDYLAQTPNFDRERSRYQIEHVTGGRGVDAYTPPGCQTMQTNGICPLDKRDGICMRIKHPLSYYRKRLWMQQRDQEQAEAAKPAKDAKRAAVEPDKEREAGA